MKFKDEDDKALLLEACIIEEMKYTLAGNDDTKEAFQKLKETIENSDNLSFEYLSNQNSDNDFAVRRFFDYLKTYKKHVINREYYNQAVEIAKSQSLPEEFNEKIKDKFFQENRIEGFKVRLDKHNEHKKFIAIGAPILALVAAGGLALGVASNHRTSEKNEPSTTVESTATPNPTKEPTTGIAYLDVNDKNFSNHLKNDFQSFYVNEYNSSNATSLSTDDLIINTKESQNYVYKVKVGNEYRYISHGNQPQQIEQYFKNNQINPEIVKECKSFSVYATDSAGNIKKEYDEFGNLSDVKLDSAVQIGDKYLKLYDGNNPKGFLNPKSNSKSALLPEMNDILYTFTCSTNTENDRKTVKDLYISAIQEYQESKTLVDCGLEVEIDDKLPKQELKELEDRER